MLCYVTLWLKGCVVTAPGEIQGKGMVLPLAQDTYRPIVKRLEAEDLVARESSTMIKVAAEKQDEAVRY